MRTLWQGCIAVARAIFSFFDTQNVVIVLGLVMMGVGLTMLFGVALALIVDGAFLLWLTVWAAGQRSLATMRKEGRQQ